MMVFADIVKRMLLEMNFIWLTSKLIELKREKLRPSKFMKERSVCDICRLFTAHRTVKMSHGNIFLP